MSVSADLDFQNLSTVQSNQQQFPVTIAATTSAIAITTKLTFITGSTTQVTTITPPSSGYCEITLCFISATPGAFATTGNIQIAYQPIINRPIDLCYDPISAKWWVKAVV